MKYRNVDLRYRKPEYLKLFRFLAGRIFLENINPGRCSEVLSLPAVENPAEKIAGLEGDFAMWIGHSTILCRHESLYYLTDPVFSQRASPFVSLGPRRYSPPAMAIDALPKISFVLISHNHYDHLDYSSVKAVYEKDRPLFFVPEGLSGWFKSAGIETAAEIPWWRGRKVDRLTISSVPAQHFSARTMWDRNNSHWCGWVVGGKKKFYYSGDSGYFNGFKEIGKKFGPIDLAALPIGAYEPAWFMRRHHLNPAEALDAFEDVLGRKFLAVHWGSFDLTYEPCNEPPKRLKMEVAGRRYNSGAVNILRVGELISW
jgi:L-ascorbate metabolism protein UlaG (beta-lactamase superfamily)